MLKFRPPNYIRGAALLSIALTSAFAHSESGAVPTPFPAIGDSLTSGTSSIQVGLSDTDSMNADTEQPQYEFLCVFEAHGDFVHVSSSAFEASGHGWWRNLNCNATHAEISVQLQEYYSDNSWRNKGKEGVKVVKSGGGSGKRATGRAACNNGDLTGWRSVIDVNVLGPVDLPDKLVTPPQNIRCRRY